MTCYQVAPLPSFCLSFDKDRTMDRYDREQLPNMLSEDGTTFQLLLLLLYIFGF